MKSYLLICIFTFLVSLVNEAFRPANSTAIAFYSKPEHRTRSYALNRLAINVGWAVGILVGGWITEINFELLFWVDGITNIAAAFLMWFVLKPVDYKPVKQAAELTVPTQSAYKDKTYLWFIAITFLFAACFFQIIQVLPLFFKKELHFSGFYIGVLMAINGIIIAVIEMVMVYKLEGRRRSMSYIVFGVMLTGLSFLTLNLPFMGAQLAIVMILLVTFGEIFSMPFMNSYWIARTQPSNRGQYAGLYTMAWSAAQCLGPLLGAQVAYYWGYTALWWIVGVLALIAAFAFSKLQKAS